MKFLVGFILYLVSQSLFAQEPQKKAPESVDELFEKENPEAFYSKISKSDYLVLDRYRKSKRKRFYVGNQIHFKTRELGNLNGELTEIKDSTITIALMGYDLDRIQLHTTNISEITKLYKNKPYKGIRLGWNWATPAVTFPVFYDWIYFKKSPLNNREGWLMVMGIETARILIVNKNKYFNSIKINGHNQLKIFKSY
jgi:hypothetical protein